MRWALATVPFLVAACSDTGLSTFNAEPVAIITSHRDGDPVSAGTTVLFRGAASDPDDPASSLRALWLVDGAVACDSTPPDADGITECAVEIGAATTTIGLEVRDGDNAVGLDEVGVLVCGTTFWRDADEDGYGDPADTTTACEVPAGFVTNDGDCDDGDPLVEPTAAEVCDDGIDNDCDTLVDEECLGTNCFDDTTVIADLAYYSRLGRIDTGDAPGTDGLRRDDYELQAVAGDQLAVHAWSDELDTTVELYDPDCALYDLSEDGARGTNAFLRFRVPDDGIWTVVVTTAVTESRDGGYFVELLDDSTALGTNCGLDTDVLDLVTSTTDSYAGRLAAGDQLWDASVGVGFYYDDVELWSFYGDTLQADLTSSAFDPVLSLYGPGCGLITYDTNSGPGNAAQIVHATPRTGIFTLAPWGEYSWSTGNYTLTATASF